MNRNYVIVAEEKEMSLLQNQKWSAKIVVMQ